MNKDNSSKLIQSYFLGTISEDEMAELDKRLREDGDLRAQFAATARLDTNLRDAASSVSMENQQASRGQSHQFLFGLGIAAVITLCAILAFQFQSPTAPPPIATFEELNGSVTWIAGGKQIEEHPGVGDELTGGTLEVSSMDSWAKVVFRDGSNIWVSGPAVVNLSDGDAGKLVRVREGELSLDVSPQPQGKPLRVVTPSAEAVVLGTQFNLSAKPTSTNLTVNKGLVRVTRLSDGSIQEVEANHTVIASLEQESLFKALPLAKQVQSWYCKLSRDRRHGEWKPEGNGHPEALLAKAHLYRGDHWDPIDPILLHSVVVGPSLGAKSPVLLSEGSHVQIHGKLDRSFKVNIGFGTYWPHGGFSGKFSTWRKVVVDKGSGGLFEINLSLDDFPRMKDSFPKSPAGHELFWFWILTVDKDVGLELHGLKLYSTDSTSNL